MRFDLKSGTDAGSHALFDPGAVEALASNAPQMDWQAWIRRQEIAGSILTYSEGSDGSIRLKVVVDEEFGDAGHTKTILLDQAILRVPTGKLYFTGIEYICWTGVPNLKLQALDPPIDIPPGNYGVMLCRVNWKMGRRRIDQELDAILEPGDRDYAWFSDNCVMPAGCMFMLGGVITSIVLLMVLHQPW